MRHRAKRPRKWKPPASPPTLSGMCFASGAEPGVFHILDVTGWKVDPASSLKKRDNFRLYTPSAQSVAKGEVAANALLARKVDRMRGLITWQLVQPQPRTKQRARSDQLQLPAPPRVSTGGVLVRDDMKLLTVQEIWPDVPGMDKYPAHFGDPLPVGFQHWWTVQQPCPGIT